MHPSDVRLSTFYKVSAGIRITNPFRIDDDWVEDGADACGSPRNGGLRIHTDPMDFRWLGNTEETDKMDFHGCRGNQSLIGRTEYQSSDMMDHHARTKMSI